MEAANTAQGSALEENSKYLSSVEGMSQRLSSAFQKLSDSVIDSGWLKGISSVGEFLTNGLTTVNELSGGAMSLSVVLAALVIGAKTLSQTGLGRTFKAITSSIGESQWIPFIIVSPHIRLGMCTHVDDDCFLFVIVTQAKMRQGICWNDGLTMGATA
jgi:hypothetical protein